MILGPGQRVCWLPAFCSCWILAWLDTVSKQLAVEVLKAPFLQQEGSCCSQVLLHCGWYACPA